MQYALICCAFSCPYLLIKNDCHNGDIIIMIIIDGWQHISQLIAQHDATVSHKTYLSSNFLE